MNRKISVFALLMLVVALLMSGCGSSNGSSGTTPNVGSGSGDNGGIVTGNSSDNSGYIVINFHQGSSKASVLNSVSSSLPSAQWARVVISHVSTSTYTDPDTDEIYTTVAIDYKQIIDVNLSSSTTTSIPVPPNTGYQVDVVSYLAFIDHNTLLKYGKSAAPVDVTSGNTTTVTITAVPFDAGLVPPTSIASGALYNVAVSYGGSPLRSERNLLVSDTPINTVYAYSAIAPFPSFQRIANALTVADPPQTIYFQGLFFLSDNLLNPVKESWKNWRYYEPNPAEFGDAQVTSTLMPPGAITIDVTL